MACLLFFPVKAHPGGTLAYITRKDAILSDESHDVYRALNYMGESESTRRVYVYSNHCSQNPRLAEQEMKLHQEMYYQSKKGAKPHKGELLALHFVLSYSKEDRPNVQLMDYMMQKLIEHPLLQDYAALGAHHFDKPQRHSHFVSNQFSAVGKPRKMGLQKDDIYELMRFSNKLAVENGLSIIDNSELRKDPEYSAWVDSVIASGTVTVHEEKKIRRSRSKKNIPYKNHYYRWMKEQEERSEAEYNLMTETQRRKKDFEKKYYWTPGADEEKRWYVSGDPRQRFYTVSRVSPDGYLRSGLELAVRFVLFVAQTEGVFIQKNDPYIWAQYHAKVDKELQGMADFLAMANKLNVNKVEQIYSRLGDIGMQMNALRRERARHVKSIEKQKEIIEAYQTYVRVRRLVEGVQDPQSADVSEYKKAYAVLVQNQILTIEAYTDLCRRHDFEKQKIVDYDRRMPELQKQYHDLKKLEALAAYPEKYLREIFSYSRRAFERTMGNDGSLDSVIHDARSRAIDESEDLGGEKDIEII